MVLPYFLQQFQKWQMKIAKGKEKKGHLSLPNAESCFK